MFLSISKKLGDLTFGITQVFDTNNAWLTELKFQKPKKHNLSNLTHHTVEKSQKNHGVLRGPQFGKQRWWDRIGILRIKEHKSSPLAPWCRVFLEKFNNIQIIQYFSFYATTSLFPHSRKKIFIPSKLKVTSSNHFSQEPFRKNGFFLCGFSKHFVWIYLFNDCCMSNQFLFNHLNNNGQGEQNMKLFIL